MRSCKDYPKAAGCCDSCHDDADEWGYDLIELRDERDRVVALVCCRVANSVLDP